MRIVSIVRIVLFATLLSGAGGCATLRMPFGDDEQRQQAELAQRAQVICTNTSRRLLVKERSDAELVVVTAIDTVSTHSYWRGLFNATPYATAIVLTQGPHVLQVQYHDAVFYGDGELSLDAEAGKIYKLQKKVMGLSVQFWIEDELGQRITNIGRGELHGDPQT